jgi:hypothetical protein
MENVGILCGLWHTLRPFGMLYGHLAYFVVIWYIFTVFGMSYQEKSGNPDRYIALFSDDERCYSLCRHVYILCEMSGRRLWINKQSVFMTIARVWQQTSFRHLGWLVTIVRVIRVTRLGEFSPNGQQFSPAFFTIAEVDKSLVATFFPRKILCIDFDLGKKYVWPHFGRFFRKLIWSPCSCSSLFSLQSWRVLRICA